MQGLKIDCVFTKAARGRKAILAPRCFQFFANGRPCHPWKKVIHIIQDLYRDFRVPTCSIPYFLMHIQCEPKHYDLKI